MIKTKGLVRSNYSLSRGGGASTNWKRGSELGEGAESGSGRAVGPPPAGLNFIPLPPSGPAPCGPHVGSGSR